MNSDFAILTATSHHWWHLLTQFETKIRKRKRSKKFTENGTDVSVKIVAFLFMKTLVNFVTEGSTLKF